MNPLVIELDFKSAVELYLVLGEDDGGLAALRRQLLDFLYEHLTIEELEKLESARHESANDDFGLRNSDKKGR